MNILEKIKKERVYFDGGYGTNLQKAGIEAKVDVYPNCFHAFDMMLPFKKVSKEAIAEFEKQFCYAVKHYFAPQKK